MLKKYSILVAGLLGGMGALFGKAKEFPKAEMELYSGGFVTGLGLTTLGNWIPFGGNSAGIIQLGYYGSCWMVDLGLNGVAAPKSSASAFVLGHLGGRNRLYQNLFITYGAMGLGHFASKKPRQNGWSVGAFAGLDYQLSKHFMLSGKVYPYNYERERLRSPHNIFGNSTLSLFYVF